MEFLTKDQIISKQDLKYIDVEVEAWGGTIRLFDLTAAGRFRLMPVFAKDSEATEAEKFAHVIIECACDENGEKLFSIDDVSALVEKDFNTLMNLFNTAAELTGLTEKAENDIKKN